VTPVGGLLPTDPSRIAPPRARFLYSDTIGEWAIRFLLKRSLSEEEASAAAEGWRGDRLAFYVAGEDLSYVWRIRFESGTAADRFASALERARKGRPNQPRIARAGADVVVTLGFAEAPALPGGGAPAAVTLPARPE
jgi:hypothetical protein